MIKVHDHSISWHCNEVFFANSYCLLAAISANKMIDNFNSALSPCVKGKRKFSFFKEIGLYIISYSSHFLSTLYASIVAIPKNVIRKVND